MWVLQLQVELLPLGLLPPVLVLVQASVVLPVLMPEPQLVLAPQQVPVMDSELEWPQSETESPLREEPVFLVHRSPAPRCQADARTQRHCPFRRPTLHTTFVYPTSGRLPMNEPTSAP